MTPPYLQLRQRKTNRPILAIGLMSGTSLDAVDAALIEITPDVCPPIKLVAYEESTFSGDLRVKISTAMDPKQSSTDLICQLNVEMGEVYGKAVKRLADHSNISLDEVDFIGSHGQTIYHIPRIDLERGWYTPSTLQIGDPCVIAEQTGVLTVGDFRIRDMAAGGVGAPLIPFVDAFLFAHPDQDVLCQNIGGIANCTLIQRNGDILAFDSGPGNMVMDLLVRTFSSDLLFDEDGKMAAKGRVIDSLLAEALSHPFFDQPPPKATGHEQFGIEFVQWLVEQGKGFSFDDLLFTACELTARSITDAYNKFIFPHAKPSEVIVSGGGIKNRHLMRRLRFYCPDIRFRPIDEFGISSDAKESVGFAVLAYATLRGIPANIPTVSGAREYSVLGKIVPGRRVLDWFCF